jgi:hypothetical protein
MNLKLFNAMLETARLREDEILKVKGDDYTIDQADEDRLFNFKEIAQLVGITPQQVWAVYFLKHVFSILAFVKGKKESEPIQGRKDDAVNYLHLFEGLVVEAAEAPDYAAPEDDEEDPPVLSIPIFAVERSFSNDRP